MDLPDRAPRASLFAVWDHWLGARKGGNGDFSNNQTRYGRHGQVLGSYPPNGSRSYYAVWKIKPC